MQRRAQVLRTAAPLKMFCPRSCAFCAGAFPCAAAQRMHTAQKMFCAPRRHAPARYVQNRKPSGPHCHFLPQKRCASRSFRRNGHVREASARRHALHRPPCCGKHAVLRGARGMYRYDEDSSVCSNRVPPVSADSVHCISFLEYCRIVRLRTLPLWECFASIFCVCSGTNSPHPECGC